MIRSFAPAAFASAYASSTRSPPFRRKGLQCVLECRVEPRPSKPIDPVRPTFTSRPVKRFRACARRIAKPSWGESLRQCHETGIRVAEGFIHQRHVETSKGRLDPSRTARRDIYLNRRRCRRESLLSTNAGCKHSDTEKQCASSDADASHRIASDSW